MSESSLYQQWKPGCLGLLGTKQILTAVCCEDVSVGLCGGVIRRRLRRWTWSAAGAKMTGTTCAQVREYVAGIGFLLTYL
jgi:hypothetical protein